MSSLKTIQKDVVVCGGGVSGLAAALTAARAGASVAIVEEDARIGGAPTDMYIQMFCGTPYQGLFKELHEKMRAYAPTKQTNCFRHSSYLLAYHEWFKELPVEIFTAQKVVRVQTAAGGGGNKIAAVESKDRAFEGKVFIDATGNGDVAALAGCPFRMGREAAAEFDEDFAPEKADGAIQRCTLMYTIRRRADWPEKSGAGTGAALEEDEALIWGPSVVCKDPTDDLQLAAATAEAIGMMPAEVEKWSAKGYYVTSVAPKLGVREARRVEGLYMLSYLDIYEQRKFADGVCVVNYGIDPWDPDGNPMHDPKRKKKTAMPDYEIPYRCLVNATVDNLIVTGRCISATHVANSSLRVMGIAIPLGQAAGNAAALAARHGTAARDIDVAELVAAQRKGGVRTSLNEPPIAG